MIRERRFTACKDVASCTEDLFVFRAVLDNTLVPTAFLDTNFDFVLVNPAYAALDEHEPEDFIGRNHFDLYPDTGNEHIFRQVLETGEPYVAKAKPFEYTEHPERGVSHWDWTLAPVRGPDGEIKGLVLSLINVTDRIQAIEQVAEKEAYFRHLVETTNAIPWEADAETFRFTYVGPQAAQITGYLSEDWYAPGFWVSRVHPDDLEQAAEYCRKMTQQALDHEFEYRFIAAGGRVMWIRDVVQVVVDEAGAMRLQGFMFDITARKQAELALHEREIELKYVIGNAPLVLWLIDVQGMITLSEGRGLQVMGGDAVGKTVHEYFRGDPQIVALADRALAGEEFTAVERYKGRVYEIHYSPLKSDEGAFQGAIGLAIDITERVKAYEQVRRSERELSAILNNLQDTYYRTDPEGRITHASPSVRQLLGFDREEVLGMRLAGIYVDPQGREKFMRALEQAGGAVTNYEARIRRRDGRVIWVSTSAQFYRNEAGEIAGIEGITRDVTERREAEERMRKLSMAVEQTADAVTIANREGVIEYVNRAFETVSGYARQEAIGRKSSILSSGRQERAFYERMWETILRGEVYRGVVINKRKDGGLYYEEKTITPLQNSEGDICHFVATGRDITERMETQNRLHYLAHHDVLTGLPNRALFGERLSRALAARHRRTELAVMFLDLDRFKTINDSLGHDIGDAILQELADRLRGCVGGSDTVARLGGDEFAILLEAASGREYAEAVAGRILAALTEPIDLVERQLFITTSIGISLHPVDGEDASTLIKNADLAMYHAKEQGRNIFRFYSRDMGAKAYERMSLETSLRQALQREEFVLHYQPQVDIWTGEVAGLEALLRWEHPTLGLVPPVEFIPVLEETGLIVQVGEWALRTACRAAARWQTLRGYPTRIAVNLSGRQFSDAGLITVLKDILDETGLSPADLELEITESVIMRDDKEAMLRFKALHEMGVRIAIDDFGTGYSSLSYLKRFPINTLKVDRSFIRDLTIDPDDATIVQAITAMAGSLGLDVVAEGVEQEEQLEFLRGEHCRLAQGYLISRPVDASAIEAQLLNGLDERQPG
ncbi:MAG: PAS domain S-box protein [Gammaproteobacteria bacterium]